MVRTSATRAAAAAGLAVSLLAAGCGVPIPDATPPATSTEGRPGGGERVDRLEPVDVRSTELTAALRTLSARIDEARMLVAAEQDAVGVLLGVAGGGAAPSVLPTITPDRAGTATDDLTTELTTLATNIGGERGRLVIELTRDPMLGDLGAWQRDPVGLIDGLRALATDTEGTAADSSTLDAALREVSGELPRALAYAIVVASSDDPALVTHAATQSAGRLGVVLIAIDLAIERLEEDT